MSQIVLHAVMVLASASLYALALAINEWAFIGLQETPGINWVFLPAGIRLCCTLLFGFWGAVGLWLASFFIATHYLFPDQAVHALVVSLLSALSPYLVYLSARHYFGLAESLINLSPHRLIICCIFFGICNAVLHHVWFLLYSPAAVSIKGFSAMLTGDIVGALLVLYVIKAALALLPRTLLASR